MLGRTSSAPHDELVLSYFVAPPSKGIRLVVNMVFGLTPAMMGQIAVGLSITAFCAYEWKTFTNAEKRMIDEYYKERGSRGLFH